MTHIVYRLANYAIRLVIAAGCCWGIWNSLTLARADHLFRKDTEQAVRSALLLAPDGWEYYMRLAQLDQVNAQQLLNRSLQLNRYNAQAGIELGLQYEADGDFQRAEQELLRAYEIDHTYLPRWSLANFYLRRDNFPAFWQWARSAASMPADDIGLLFELCWSVSPAPGTLNGELLNDKPEFLRQYIRFLLGKEQPGAVASIAPHLIRAGDPESDRQELFGIVNQLIVLKDAGAANNLWHLLIDHHWAVVDTAVPNNGNFQREPLPVSFDWSIPEYGGLHSWPGRSGLETEFSGSEPEDCTIAMQTVILAPGDYAMNYDYRTSEIPPATGIRWQIIDLKSNIMLMESDDLSSEDGRNATMTFSVPPETSLLALRLAYKRTIGTPRISGMLNVHSVQIKVHSSDKLPNVR
jgi:tetratricopeptide (TPR) repeat protein